MLFFASGESWGRVMNKILGSIALAMVIAGPAMAADMPLKAPPPPAVFSWTGCYAGIEGGYVAGQRHGYGVYRWTTGDVYRGPWREDIATGPPTPMMLAQARWREEARAAVAREGQKVCRELPVGIGGRDWVRGVVVAVSDGKVAVRIDDLGSGANALAAVVKPGQALLDQPEAWTPCY